MRVPAAQCSCIYCKEVKSAKGIFSHVDRAHLGATHYSSGYNGKYEQISAKGQEERQKKVTEYDKSPNVCDLCGCSLDYDSRFNKHCSSSCAGIATNAARALKGWTMPVESNSKRRETLQATLLRKGSILKPVAMYNLVCLECNKPFVVKRENQKFCNMQCAGAARKGIYKSNRTALMHYRDNCRFKFNLKDYPTEFNFDLIEQYGWYKPTNHGDNISGVSRDHIVSVRWGFDNDTDPSIISHPANCQLMKHSDNSSKGIHPQLTLEELLSKIEKWELKYNKV